MKEYFFKVDGIQGKQRPRFSKGHTYTPKETVQYEKAVAEAYRNANGIKFDKETPVRLNVNIHYDIPKSYTKKRTQEIIYKALRPIKKPDIDNIAKIVLDGLNGTAYEDDTQVVELDIRKFYSSNAESHIEVYVREISW